MPRILPGGRALLISVHDGEARFRIDVLTLATGERRTSSLADSMLNTRRPATSYTPRAMPCLPSRFDVDRLTVTGTPVKLLDGVETDRQWRRSSRSRRLARWCFSRNRRPPTERWCGPIVRASPRQSRSSRGRSGHRACRRMAGNSPLSSMTDGRRNIWIYRFDNATFLPIASEGINRAPVWTRDGLRLTYLSERDGVRHLMSQPSDSSAPAESLLTSQNDDLFPGSWSADGRSLVYVDQPPTDNSELRVLPIDGRQVATLSGIPAAQQPAGDLARRPVARVRHPAVRGIRAASDLRTGRFQAPGRHVNSSMPPASQCGAGTARRSFFAADAAGRRRLPATGSSKCLSIVRVASLPARNGNCSGKPLPKTR